MTSEPRRARGERLEQLPEKRRRNVAPVVRFVLVWLGVPWLVLGAALAPVLPGGWLVALLSFGVFALPIWVLAQGFAGVRYPGKTARLFVARPFWYAMLFLPMLAIAAVLGGLSGWLAGAPGVFARGALAVAATVLALVSIVGYFGSRRLVVRRLRATLPRLPKEFIGLRVVQLSDLHVGPHTSRRFLQRVFDEAQRLQPDLIAITGDQVDDFVRDVDIFNSHFAQLRAPLGVFVVAGNHDVYAGWERVRAGLAQAGFRVLVNEADLLERAGQRLWIAGTGDPAALSSLGPSRAGAPDIERTLRTVPAGEPVLALAHNPALWPALAERGVDLTLSGHTHYGQFVVPGLGWSIASPFLELATEMHRRGDSLLYINPGTNYWGLPLRIGTPPEITEIELVAGSAPRIEVAE